MAVENERRSLLPFLIFQTDFSTLFFQLKRRLLIQAGRPIVFDGYFHIIPDRNFTKEEPEWPRVLPSRH